MSNGNVAMTGPISNGRGPRRLLLLCNSFFLYNKKVLLSRSRESMLKVKSVLKHTSSKIVNILARMFMWAPCFMPPPQIRNPVSSWCVTEPLEIQVYIHTKQIQVYIHTNQFNNHKIVEQYQFSSLKNWRKLYWKIAYLEHGESYGTIESWYIAIQSFQI